MVVIRGRLTPEVGAVAQRALDAAADRLLRESAKTPYRRASPTRSHRRSAGPTPWACWPRRRYQVILRVEPEALRAEPAAPPDTGHAVLEDGPYVSWEMSQRLACDTAVVVMRHTADGSVLNVGRKTRTILPAMRLPRL